MQSLLIVISQLMIWFQYFQRELLKLGQNLSLNDKDIQKFEIALKKLCLKFSKTIVS